MSDPRKGLGYEVEDEVVGPYSTLAALPSDNGGTLDRGIVATTKDGRRVVIGEVWAAAVGPGGEKIRIDADAIARRIVETLNGAETREGGT